MIPRTFPSVTVDGVTCCVVSVITPTVNQQAWIDYIPVKSVDVIPAKVNRYDTDGAIGVSALADISNKQGWLDYIPVVLVDNDIVHAWTTNALGYIPVKTLQGVITAWDPSFLFTAGEQGAWYDPSDTATLFQDSAGTTPVTAVEQPVGLILDKSGRGNHAFQTDPLKRPLWSARVNFLERTEDLTASPWVTFVQGSAAASRTLVSGGGPGGLNATRVTLDRSDSISWAQINQVFTTAAANTYRVRFQIKASLAGDIGKQIQYCEYQPSGGAVLINIVTVTLTADWQVISTVGSAQLSAGTNRQLIFGYIPSNFGGLGATGPVEFLLATPDLRVANESSALPPYQRVVTATDYDAGPQWPKYLRFDGSNDALVTNSINFTATDEMSVFAGVRKLSDAEVIVVELSASVGLNAGSFYIVSGGSNGVDGGRTGWHVGARGAAALAPNQIAQAYTFAAPDTAVISSTNDISGDLSTIRRNAVAGVSATGDKGAGNFGNYPLYIGARAGTSVYFNGRLHSLIVLGRTVTPTELTQTEGYVEAKTFGKDMNYVLYEPVLGSDGDQITLTAGGDDLFVYQNYE